MSSDRGSGIDSDTNKYIPPRLRQKNPAILSEDSEFSDLDYGLSALTLSKHENRTDADEKLICSALVLLQTITKVSSKRLFSYWSAFLPETNLPRAPDMATPSNRASLLNFLLHDPSIRVRTNAAVSLEALLDGSKPLLAVAMDSPATKSSSFTSLAETMSRAVHLLHQGLLFALKRERALDCTLSLLSCLSILIDNTTYARLSPNLLGELLRDCLALIGSEKNPLAVASLLRCLRSILSAECRATQLDELQVIAFSNDSLNNQSGNLVQFLLAKLSLPESGPSPTYSTVQSLSLGVLGALIQRFPEPMK